MAKLHVAVTHFVLGLFRVVKSSWLPAKIATYLVSIGRLLCLAFLYRWCFSNKISLHSQLTLTTQLSMSKLSDNPGCWWWWKNNTITIKKHANCCSKHIHSPPPPIPLEIVVWANTYIFWDPPLPPQQPPKIAQTAKLKTLYPTSQWQW